MQRNFFASYFFYSNPNINGEMGFIRVVLHTVWSLCVCIDGNMLGLVGKLIGIEYTVY